MSHPLGFSRNVIKERYALLTPAGFVPSVLPGWTNCTVNILISPGMGARFNQYLVTATATGQGQGTTSGNQLLVYVVDGEADLTFGRERAALNRGNFVYIPPATDYVIASKRDATRLLIFEKPYQPLAGIEAPKQVIVGHETKVKSEAFLGDPDAQLQALLPDNPSFDMAVNIFTYKPGATLPFVETHIMEHGLMFLKGQGVYRLDADWYPVQEGDVIWMAPYCPQWFVASGKQPAVYIYYKDVNRAPL